MRFRAGLGTPTFLKGDKHIQSTSALGVKDIGYLDDYDEFLAGCTKVLSHPQLSYSYLAIKHDN